MREPSRDGLLKNGEWKAWVDDAAFFADTMPRADLIRHLESQFPFTHKMGNVL